MGRYYYGDIEGKFWFGVQPSNAADRFGVIGSCDNDEDCNFYIAYYFERKHLSKVQIELKAIEQSLGENLQKLNAFFKEKNGYNDEMLVDFLEVPLEKVKIYLRDYADYDLGKKIELCIIKDEECFFEGDL